MDTSLQPPPAPRPRRVDPSHPRRRGRRSVAGVSLVECLVVIGLVAVIAASAAPSFQSLLARRAVEGLASELATDLLWARSEAVARNDGVRVTFDSVHACYVVQAGDDGECRCSGEAQGSVATVCTGTTTALKTGRVPASPAVSLQASVRSTRFDPQFGTATPAFTDSIEGVTGLAVRHVVNLMGRVRSCSPGGAMPGYRAC